MVTTVVKVKLDDMKAFMACVCIMGGGKVGDFTSGIDWKQIFYKYCNL